MNLDKVFEQFKSTYVAAAVSNGLSEELAQKNIDQLYELCLKEINTPSSFGIYHEKELTPFDYSRFGTDFFSALIDKPRSSIRGKENLHNIVRQVKTGDNVILLANHQTEPDPQVISILLKDVYPEFADEVIFVAGHRVVTDPVAIPFSRGRNLLCIYSKRHIENPPEKREEKVLHNRKALDKLKSLLQEGGKCVYVAPSGGRDRADAEGLVRLSPFDPGSIELFRLVAKGTNTHFYPFAMNTYDILPPPTNVRSELGEERLASLAPVHVYFGEEADLDNIPNAPQDKQERRQARADYVFELVKHLYKQIR